MRHTCVQLVFCAVLVLGRATWAADTGGALEQGFGNYEVARRATVLSLLRLTAEESRAFEPIYDDYRTRAQRLVARRVAQLRAYAEAWNNPGTDSRKVRSLAREMFAIDRRHLAELEAHVDKAALVLPPAKALDYLVIEARLDAYARETAMRLLPGHEVFPEVPRQ